MGSIDAWLVRLLTSFVIVLFERVVPMELDLLLKIGFWVLCFKNLGNEIFILNVFCFTVRTTEVFFI